MTDYSKLTLSDLENMSDDDFAKLDPSQFDQAEDEPEAEATTEEQTQGQEEDTEVVTEQVVEQTTQDEPEQTTEEVEGEVTANETESEANTSHDADDVAPKTDEVQEQKKEPEVSREKAFYDKVTAEFQANGKSFKIDNEADVISLMQKGLNYNQKMAAMKPSMKIVRALQQAGIESEEQLGFLLDLQAKKPEAIAKLVQDSGIDTFQYEEQAKAYRPQAPQVSDAQINFEMVANDLSANPHFSTVVNNLTTYDEKSKEKVFENPHYLNILTEHVERGFYDKIVARVQQEQALGRLNGLPFIEAYSMVGDMLFAPPQQQAATIPNQVVVNQAAVAAQPVPVPVATKPKAVNNTARQAAAAANSSAKPTQQVSLTPEQLWNMSDEEFAKIDPKFLK